MAEYRLSELSPLGVRDEKYGQTYWGKAFESQVPIMFNAMVEVSAGDKIEFESMAPMKSKKGNDYMRLKKVKVLEKGAVQRPQAEDKFAELEQRVRALESAVFKGTSRDPISEPLGTPTESIEKGADELVETPTEEEDERIDLSNVPF